MTDAEVRGRLLKHFYDFRHTNGGFVGVNEMVLDRNENVTLDVLRGVCLQLYKSGLIEWSGYIGNGPVIGRARITGPGVDTIDGLKQTAGTPPVAIDLKWMQAESRERKESSLRRIPELIASLLQKLEQLPYGEIYSFNGSDPEVAIDGYSSDEIAYHLDLLREMGLIDSPGSQPMLGVTFAGLSVKGHDYLEKERNTPTDPANWGSPPKPSRSRKVFIVHGHDEAPRESVARFLSQLDFVPVILHEQANKGRTIIEKFEANSDVGFVVVLLTPDDVGGKIGSHQAHRARQNVLLEWGFFIGRLGRDHVCALKKGDVELPSDIIGVVWEPFDDNGAWKGALAKELAAAGLDVDWNRLHA